MATTVMETWQDCRFCSVKIQPANPAQTYWVDVEGWAQCMGTEDFHAPRSVCHIVDQITEWTDKDGKLLVHEGDLILRDYRFELVERIYFDPAENLVVRVELAGHRVAMNAQPADLVAVRRYIIEETNNA